VQLIPRLGLNPTPGAAHYAPLVVVVAADHLEERGPQSDLGGVPPALAPPPGHPRFAHIDGVRAIAALCVLVFNAVANGLIRSSTPFEEVYVQPAAGDSGTAVGAAYQERYHRLIERFSARSGTPIVLNTSFNENEPIVCTPEEAINCFLKTQMDVLVLENHVISRNSGR
jgi:hypothetical protein